MKIKRYHLLFYIILLLINKFGKCEKRINENKDEPIYYTLDVLDIYNDTGRYHYTYNYTTYSFNEKREIEEL